MGAAEPSARIRGVRRVLVLRRRALGDLLLTLPAVRALAESYPEAGVDLLVDVPLIPVVRGLPYVHEVIAFPDQASTPRGRGRALLSLFASVRRAGYDLVVDALGTPRTAQLAWWSGARVRAGFAIRGRSWAYTVTVPRSDRHRPVYMRDAYLELVAAVGATTADRSFAQAMGEVSVLCGPSGGVAVGMSVGPNRPTVARPAPTATCRAPESEETRTSWARSRRASAATSPPGAFWTRGSARTIASARASSPGPQKTVTRASSASTRRVASAA